MVTKFMSVTMCDGNCDGIIVFVTEWQVHVKRGNFVTDVSKFVTDDPVTIQKFVRICDGPVTIRRKPRTAVTDCDGPVTILETKFFFGL